MLRTIIGILITSVFLICSFPQTHAWPLVWVALVPWFYVLEGKSLKATFGWSFLVGFIFFAGTLGWFIYVTFVGAFVLICYLSLYFAVFGLAFYKAQDFPALKRVFFLSAVWVVLEYLRAHLISGFSWASLAHSQYTNTLLIQIADITGFYGISFLIVSVNVLLAASLKKNAQVKLTQAIVIVCLIGTLAYGFWKVKSFDQNIQGVTVGVVQPNIMQDMKWDPRMQPWIMQKTINTTMPLAKEGLDLIVWPETSLPGVVSEVPWLVQSIANTASQIQAPILFGAITDHKKQYFNSAYLISAMGKQESRYDKIHLVPFGEYIPWQPALSWLKNIVGLEDFTPGQEYTLMSAGKDKVPFAVLICFEDSVNYLRRNFTKAGAQFFVNMTNDAWFKDTKAPWMHLSAAVLASVETKRSLVRAANTGVSGFIDPLGRVIGLVEDQHGKRTFVAGSSKAMVPLSTELTFYTKYADIFTFGCLLFIMGSFLQRSRGA